MPIWLIPIVAWLQHNVVRFVGVVLIGVMIIGTPISIYYHIYNKGYKKGYAQAMTDHPQNVGVMNVGDKESFFILKIWKLKFSI